MTQDFAPDPHHTHRPLPRLVSVLWPLGGGKAGIRTQNYPIINAVNMHRVPSVYCPAQKITREQLDPRPGPRSGHPSYVSAPVRGQPLTHQCGGPELELPHLGGPMKWSNFFENQKIYT